jgi:hypothetical protein
MMRRFVVVLLLAALSAQAWAEEEPAVAGDVTKAATAFVDGVFYFEHGHYYIELTFYDSEGAGIVPSALERSRFEILRLGEEQLEPFHPSRVRIRSYRDESSVVVLSSGRLKRGYCYSVVYRPPGAAAVAADSICDPFHFTAGEAECGTRSFYREYIAAAFRRAGPDGDTTYYDLNQLKFEYDFTAEKATGYLLIEPRFRFGGWKLEPAFEYSSVSYETASYGRKPGSKRRAGIAAAWTGWRSGIGISFTGGYDHERSTLSSGGSSESLYGQSLLLAGSVRLDNFFDPINRYCRSVFKGVDLGCGYAWYDSNDEEVWGSSDFEESAPVASARATWTFLYGFQLSYWLTSAWPSSHGREPALFHSLRFRLLLRDIFAGSSGSIYHPDLELSWDRGERLPLFMREEKVSLGFTFDLYPW